MSAVAFAIRTATDPTMPANGGAMRPIRVITQPGTVVAAIPPVAVGAGNVEVSQRVADVCLAALAQAVPDRIGAAGQGTMNNLLVGGDGWVYYETIGGGQGARPWADGMSGVHTAMTNTLDTPVEALERALPVRVRRYTLRRGSGGAGAHTGGDGIERELEMLEPVTLSLITERRVSAPWGLAGGLPGATGENWLIPNGDTGAARRLPDKCTVHLQPGDVVRILTPGGGGWLRTNCLARLTGAADADDLDRERAAGAFVADRVARCSTEERLAERRRRRQHVEGVVALFDRADEVGGGVSSPSMRISTMVPGATTSPDAPSPTTASRRICSSWRMRDSL